MKNTIDECIEILNAFKEGKEIEFYNNYGSTQPIWQQVKEKICYYLHEYKCRIKQEPVEVDLDESDFIGKDVWVRDIDYDYYRILCVTKHGISINALGFKPYKELKNYFEISFDGCKTWQKPKKIKEID